MTCRIGAHVGYSAAKRTRAAKPPGPFVLSEALYTKAGKRRVYGPSNARSNAVNVLAGTEEEPDVMGERTVHQRRTAVFRAATIRAGEATR